MPECVPNVTIVTHLTHISASPLYSSNILPETWTFLVCSPEHRKDLLSKYYTAKSQNDVFYNCNHNLPGGFLCCRGPPPRALRSDMITASLASLIPLPGHANSSDTEGCSGHLKSQPLGFLEIEIKPKINSDSVLFFKTCLYHVPFVFVCSLEFLFASMGSSMLPSSKL